MAIRRNQKMKTGAHNTCTAFHTVRAYSGAEQCIRMDGISIA